MAGIVGTVAYMVVPRVFLCSGMAEIPGIVWLRCLTFLRAILISFSIKSAESVTSVSPSFCNLVLWTVVSPI